MSEADYLVIGAGAAGSVLANRLTESGKARVILLEAGRDFPPGREPADIRSVFPLSAFNRRYMWPDSGVHWRRRETSPSVPLPQGRLVGGSSQLMGMWALRGHPEDYEQWAAEGATGWGWAEVLPYFRRLETDIDFAGPLHGDAGPLPIRREAPEERVPFARAIQAETRRRGWRDIADVNADFADGHGALPITREERSRASAGLHYLTAAVRARRNLDLRPNHLVERLLVEDGAVVGAVARAADGAPIELRARTTILAAGALRSPELLMRSGFGPGEMLRGAGIEVARALPGVGRNLQNHAVLYIVGMLKPEGLDPPGQRPAGSTFLRWTSGLADTPRADMALYVRSYLSWHALGRRMASLAPCLMRPASSGRITLVAPDRPSVVEFDMLADPRDARRLRDGVRLAASLFETMAEQGLCEAPVVLSQAARLARYNDVTRWNALRASVAAAALRFVPPLGRAALGRLAAMRPVTELLGDETALDAFVHRAVTGTGHVCGTCRMGAAGDPLAVTDPRGAVHGVPGLRVGDAALMPHVPAGNTHLPTVMVAEKIAAGLTGGG